MKSTGYFNTINGMIYIGKLCRHFAHKIETSYEGNEGFAQFPKGTCNMEATTDQLIFHLEAENEEGCEKMKGVIDRHLVKFAYKEPYTLHWEDDYV
jgi:hypothetical protein